MSLTYPSVYYRLTTRLTERHFWFTARRQIIASLVKRFMPSPHPSFIEIGCGTGEELKLFQDLGFEVTGLDVNAEAIKIARKKVAATLIRKSIYAFKTNKKFDGVGAFDVLEHQTKDTEFLKRCRGLLNRGGYLFLTVPAGRKLWSPIDARSGHKRRYELPELIHKVEAAGFNTCFINYGNALTLPFFLINRYLINRRKEGQLIGDYLSLPHPLINKTMAIILAIERKMFFKIKYPYGATIFLVAKKA